MVFLMIDVHAHMISYVREYTHVYARAGADDDG